MQVQEITLTIKPGGEVVTDVNGMKGPGCAEIAKWIALLLDGEVSIIERKPEFFEQDRSSMVNPLDLCG